jgi:hypothetical protein
MRKDWPVNGNIWEQLALKQRYGFSLGASTGVSVDFQRRRHVRMSELSLRDFQWCSLRVQQCAVRVAKRVPVNARQTSPLACGT